MFIQPVANLNKNCGYFLRPWPFVLSGLGHHFFHGTCWNDCIHSFPPSKLPPFPPARWVFEIWNIELQIQLWHWRNTLEHLGPVVFESNGEKFKDWQNLGDYFMWLFCVYNCIYIYIIWLVVSNVFFSPRILGEDFQFDEYVWDGLKPPPRNGWGFIFSAARWAPTSQLEMELWDPWNAVK